MYKKEDFVFFTYNPRGDEFWFYTKECAEGYHGLRSEIHLTSYLTAGDDMFDMIAMVYPEVPVDKLRSALKMWGELPEILSDECYCLEYITIGWK